MSISQPWISDLSKAVGLGLLALHKEPPLTAVEWADKHFYMSSESSYNEGKWKTDPFQVAILNAMGNDLIAVVNFVKSARIGYTKLLMANIGYKLQHKRRNVMMWSPTDPRGLRGGRHGDQGAPGLRRGLDRLPRRLQEPGRLIDRIEPSRAPSSALSASPSRGDT